MSDCSVEAEIANAAQAIKIRHYGQCPKHAGHGHPFVVFLVGAFFGAYIMLIGATLWDDGWRKDMVQRGLAHYDSQSRAFVWNK